MCAHHLHVAAVPVGSSRLISSFCFWDTPLLRSFQAWSIWSWYCYWHRDIFDGRKVAERKTRAFVPGLFLHLYFSLVLLHCDNSGSQLGLSLLLSCQWKFCSLFSNFFFFLVPLSFLVRQKGLISREAIFGIHHSAAVGHLFSSFLYCHLLIFGLSLFF